MSVAFWIELLVSSSVDGTIRLWHTETGECLGILLAQGDAWAALRPDGRYRAVGDMGQYLWHIAGLCRYELGELDEVFPELKLGENEPLIPSAYFR
jgi:WD40 repeat protein